MLNITKNSCHLITRIFVIVLCYRCVFIPKNMFYLFVGETSVRTMESFPAAEPAREHQPLPSTTTSSLGLRLPQSPRRPHHTPPPRLNIHPVPELGPPIMQVQTTDYVNDILESKGIKIKWIHMHSFLQRQSGQSRRPSMSRAPQLTPGIGSMVCPAPPANIN